jgi:hypothetical protein
MIFGIGSLFVAKAAIGLDSVTHLWPILALLAVIVTAIVIGNVSPAKVSFLPGMHYYAGNGTPRSGSSPSRPARS